jgi:hypothetical protein
MAVTINGTTGITTPGDTNTGNEAITGTLSVGGATTMGSTLAVTGAITGSGLSTTLYPLVSGTAVASTSGTSIDFTSIPSWVKRVTVMLAGVSTNGSSIPLFRIGPVGGIESSGYVGSTWEANTNNVVWSTGIPWRISGSAAYVISGVVTFYLLNTSTNTWAVQGNLARSDGAEVDAMAGYKTLAGALSIVRLTTTNGTDTFDAGSVNILYE